MAVDEMSPEDISVDNISVGEMSVDKMTLSTKKAFVEHESATLNSELSQSQSDLGQNEGNSS